MICPLCKGAKKIDHPKVKQFTEEEFEDEWANIVSGKYLIDCPLCKGSGEVPDDTPPGQLEFKL